MRKDDSDVPEPLRPANVTTRIREFLGTDFIKQVRSVADAGYVYSVLISGKLHGIYCTGHEHAKIRSQLMFGIRGVRSR